MESRNIVYRDTAAVQKRGLLVYRQSAWTRIAHWTWALSLFFLLLSGLQIFNAHPALYLGTQSGFGGGFDNAVLEMGARDTPNGPVGTTEIFGTTFETTGVLGLSERAGRLEARGFPAWATIPSFQDLATGRVVHFFFAWLLVAAMLVWLVASIFNGHLKRDVVPSGRDIRALPGDIADHARFRFDHGGRYSPLQKLSYAAVLLVLMPLMVATGLTMSPGVNAAAPWMLDLFGGRQTARAIHFTIMLLLVGFFVIHIVMVVLAGPFNELRSITTGWYRTSPPRHDEKER